MIGKTPLGSTGESVSEICLGAMRFGTSVDRPTAFAILDRYIERGGSFLDTANVYYAFLPGFKGGESESVLGEWMRERHCRPQVCLASKVGVAYSDMPAGLGRAAIMAECDKSLARLGTDCIDLYYAHCDDRRTPLEETMEAFDRLVRQGKVRRIGASNYMAWRLALANETAARLGTSAFCCLQQWYSFLRPRQGADIKSRVFLDREMIEYCGEKGLGLLCYSPLIGGIYNSPDKAWNWSAPFKGPDSQARLAALAKTAAKLGATPVQLALAWILRGKPKIIPVISASTLGQLEENLGALEVGLSPEMAAELAQTVPPA